MAPLVESATPSPPSPPPDKGFPFPLSESFFSVCSGKSSAEPSLSWLCVCGGGGGLIHSTAKELGILHLRLFHGVTTHYLDLAFFISMIIWLCFPIYWSLPTNNGIAFITNIQKAKVDSMVSLTLYVLPTFSAHPPLPTVPIPRSPRFWELWRRQHKVLFFLFILLAFILLWLRPRLFKIQ